MALRSLSSALPIAHAVLRSLIVLNWLFGACILGLLIYTFIDPLWMAKALGVSGYPDAQAVMIGMQVVAAIGCVGIVFNHKILSRLLAIIDSIRSRDPFVDANVRRLRAIAWLLLVLQLLSLIVAAVARSISTAEHPFNLDAGFSPTGWLAVILTFVLARVFAEGTLMREDLEGTV